MKRIVSFLLVCVLALGLIHPMKAQAATTALDVEIYTKQTRQLTVFAGSTADDLKAIDPLNVKWKVTKGTDKVKVGKDGLLTGKKKGKATVTATYKSTTWTYNVTVKKAPKAKAKTYKVSGVSIKMPKGFVKNEALTIDESILALQYVKNDTIIMIVGTDMGVNIEDLEQSDYDTIWPEIEKSFKDADATQVDNLKASLSDKGYEVKDCKIVSSKVLNRGYLSTIKAGIKTEPDIYVATIYTFADDKLIQISISTNSKKFADSTAKTIIKNNKY